MAPEPGRLWRRGAPSSAPGSSHNGQYARLAAPAVFNSLLAPSYASLKNIYFYVLVWLRWVLAVCGP